MIAFFRRWYFRCRWQEEARHVIKREKNTPGRGNDYCQGPPLLWCAVFEDKREKGGEKKPQNEMNADRHGLNHLGMYVWSGGRRLQKEAIPGAHGGDWHLNVLSLLHGECVAGSKHGNRDISSTTILVANIQIMVAWPKVVDTEMGRWMWILSWLGHLTGLTGQ